MRAGNDQAFTDDAVLGGRLHLRQPRRGHRFGHDAILLAAATGARSGEHAVDLGAGVGAAGLALAARVNDLRVTLIDIDSTLTMLAAENAELNGLAGRVRAVTLDVAGAAKAFTTAGLKAGSVARVLMNPPFNDPARQNISPNAGRRLAHAGRSALLAQWLKTASRLLGANGVLTLIWRADGLGDVLGALPPVFGSVAVLPVHPRADKPAIRVLVRATKGGRSPLTLYPNLLLQDERGLPSAAAEKVLRDGTTLPLAEL